MDLKRIQDFTNKNWYVDYKDEDGYDTYGPDTHEGCTKWIQSMNARVASGEKFDVDRGPYQKEAEKVQDSKVSDGYKEEYAAEDAITSDVIYDLHNQGVVKVNIPSDVDPHEFAQACIHFINEVWGEPEVNYKYEDVQFSYILEDGYVLITVVE